MFDKHTLRQIDRYGFAIVSVEYTVFICAIGQDLRNLLTLMPGHQSIFTWFYIIDKSVYVWIRIMGKP